MPERRDAVRPRGRHGRRGALRRPGARGPHRRAGPPRLGEVDVPSAVRGRRPVRADVEPGRRGGRHGPDVHAQLGLPLIDDELFWYDPDTGASETFDLAEFRQLVADRVEGWLSHPFRRVWVQMFDHLDTALSELHRFSRDLDPDRLDGLTEAQVIERSAEIEKLAAGDTSAGRLSDRQDGHRRPTRCGGLAGRHDRAVQAGRGEGRGDLRAAHRSGRHRSGGAGRRAVGRAGPRGRLGPLAADPSAEQGLLDTARKASFAELQRKAKQAGRRH